MGKNCSSIAEPVSNGRGLLIDSMVYCSIRGIELMAATTKNIVGKDWATTAEVFAGITRIGGRMCPDLIAHELHERYLKSPDAESLLVVVELSSGSNGGLDVFNVVLDDYDHWCDDCCYDPDEVWVGDYLWIFRRRKRSRS